MAVTMSTIDAVPESISSPVGKLIWLYLSINGETAVDDLAEALSIPLLQLFPVLEILEQHDLIEHPTNKNGRLHARVK